MMFASTPERNLVHASKNSKMTTTHTQGFSLPPLSAMLQAEMGSPSRPHLPALNSFATPKTPRFMLPSLRSASTPSLATLPERLAGPQPPMVSATARIMGVVPTPESRDVVAFAAAQKRPSVSASNTSMDSDVDTSGINDSMVKQSSKRKSSATSPTRDFAFISHSPATYPSQEPSIDNASLARRKRRRTSPNELAVLNESFKLGSTPDRARRIEIAEKVNMTEKAVQIWFQNKRQSLRKLKNTDREITELPPTPDTSSVLVPLPSTQMSSSAGMPMYESTPIRPSLIKSESQHFAPSPAMVQHSPSRSFSSSDLLRSPHPSTKVSLLSKMLASEERPEQKKDRKAGHESPQLVMNLTNKKQPEFARHSAQAATQVRTFKLTPRDRKPLGAVNTNTLNHPKAQSTKDSQCIQSLLSLRVGHP